MRISKNYKQDHKKALSLNIDELKNLKKEVSLLHDYLGVLWIKNNKAFGLDRLDLRFGELIARIERAESRINSYLNADIKEIEELEEEKLMFSTSEFMHCRYYNTFISASI